MVNNPINWPDFHGLGETTLIGLVIGNMVLKKSITQVTQIGLLLMVLKETSLVPQWEHKKLIKNIETINNPHKKP